MRTSKLLRQLLLAVCFWCFFHVASACEAQDYCHNCQGRCLYCVDGQCVPRRHTFGHYQTHWRRWPVPPPSIPVEDTSDSGRSMGEPDLDLPAGEDEGELDPDLAHQRESAQSLPAVETPLDAEFLDGTIKPDPFQDEQPTPNDDPGPAAGSTTRNMPRRLPMNANQYATFPQPMVGNPLRSFTHPHPMTEPPYARPTQRVGYHQPLPPRALAKPLYANPLR